MIATFLSAFFLFLLPITFGWFIMGKPKFWHMIGLALATLVSYLIWRMYSPYPSPLNWDIWEHQTAIHAILNGNISLLPSQLSDTFGFNGYTTLFHMILAVPHYIFHPDILGFWWIAEVYMVFLTGMATYALTKAVTKNSYSALLAGILSAFCFEASIVFTPFFLMPQTLTAIIWVFGLSWLINTKHLPNIFVLFLLTILLVSLHIIIGGAGVLLYMLYLNARYIHIEKTHRITEVFMNTLPIITYITLMILTYVLPLQTINSGEAAHFSQTLIQKLADIKNWYGYFPLLLVPIGIISLRQSKEKEQERMILFLFMTILAVVASPLVYSMKFFVFARYFIILYIAHGIMYFISSVGAWNKRIILIALTISQLVIFSINVTNWQESLQFRGVVSHISQGEGELASFLTHLKAGKSTMLLVSDPATSYILEAITGINTPGGAYMKPDNRLLISSLVDAPNIKTAQTLLSALTDPVEKTPVDTYVWVISARYFQWLDLPETKRFSLAFNIWRPQALTLTDAITIMNIKKNLHIQPVFTNDSAIVFVIPKESL